VTALLLLDTDWGKWDTRIADSKKKRFRYRRDSDTVGEMTIQPRNAFATR